MSFGTAVPDLTALVQPKSIAVVGASPDRSKSPGRIIPILDQLGFDGVVYPVNPRYQELDGRPCYPTVADIPDPIDVVVVMVPAKAVVPAVRDSVQRGAKFVVILSSGFAEIGGYGGDLQQQLREAVRGSCTRLYGPNCPGLWMVKEKMAITFSPHLDVSGWRSGPVGLVTHGGAMGRAILDSMESTGLGFSYWFSPGNEADLQVADFIHWFAGDPDTQIVLAILEGIRDGRRFLEAAESCRQAGKPLIVLKVGRSEAGRRAAASHTAALASEDRVVDAVFKQCGVVRVDDVDEMVDLAWLFTRYGVRNLQGVGVCSISGGSAALMADLCGYLGVPMPEPTAETINMLRQILPEIAIVGNPVDLTTQVFSKPEVVQDALKHFLSDPQIDGVLFPFPYRLGRLNTQLAQHVINMSEKFDKPIIALGISPGFEKEEAAGLLRNAGIPVIRSASKAAQVVRRYIEVGRRLGVPGVGAVGGAGGAERSGVAVGDAGDSAPAQARKLLEQKRGALGEYESRQVLACYGIRFPKGALAGSAEQAAAIAREIGWPVVLKIASPDIPHKTDAGGVLLNLTTPEEVRDGYDRLLKNAERYGAGARIDGVLVTQQIAGGEEFIVGISQDPTFGPVLAFGLGGIFVEVFKDVVMSVAPVSATAARGMIREIKGYDLLKGVRGRAPLDEAALADLLQRLSRFAVDLEDLVAEVDLNPVRVLPEGEGVVALDAMVVVK